MLLRRWGGAGASLQHVKQWVGASQVRLSTQQVYRYLLRPPISMSKSVSREAACAAVTALVQVKSESFQGQSFRPQTGLSFSRTNQCFKTKMGSVYFQDGRVSRPLLSF